MLLIYYGRDFKVMSKCTVHSDFFDDNCAECKREYADLKGHHDISEQTRKERRRSSRVKFSNYKEFTEERAKKLYEEIILQYLGKKIGEQEAAERARVIIRKQCMVRGIEVWPWVR
jgi:hypothetical protein